MAKCKTFVASFNSQWQDFHQRRHRKSRFHFNRHRLLSSLAEQVDCGHGRVETHRCSTLDDLSLLDTPQNWASLQGIVRIEAKRYQKATGKQERETRYYITSLALDAARLNAAIRQH